tara:strand:+ start:249 stop:917 length:669 start_codon:yes stop_codon:yes gene_type:complete
MNKNDQKKSNILPVLSNEKPICWFYRLKGSIRNINSEKEKRIAKNLPQRISKRYLETRGYMRKSLGELFNINPVEVPLSAEPNKPPLINNNLGYISISHCKDALVVVWDNKKIGIDIERRDREFDHKLISKKLINLKGNKINKTEVLNNWCCLESAIKWDQGSIFKDINHWELNKLAYSIFNKQKKLKLNINQFYFYDWTIAIASKKNIIKNKYFICSKDIN